MMEIIGWVGTFCFAVCGMPQAWQCYREGHSRGLSWSFLLLWAGGEVFTITYLWPKQDWVLLTNYLLNSVSLILMLRYKIWERKVEVK